MITRIELDGFKTFQNFALDLSPLQVIVGLNGTGKSNLFDALQLLSKLAESDLRTAFQNMRGEAGELFTIGPDSRPINRLRIAVEVLVNRSVTDDWGAHVELRYPRIRYELQIVRQPDHYGLDRLYVEHESLSSIPRGEDRWTQQFNLQTGGDWIPRLTGGRSTPFISTSMEHGKANLSLHQDGRSGRRNIVAEQAERTVLSGVLNTEFPHAFAVAQEFRSWRFLQINPEVLREPSAMTAPRTMSADGRYLANALARMKATDATLLHDISRDLANMVPGILSIDVEADQARDQYVIWAQMEDGRRFSSRVLSDGTLRMLALIALKNDPEHAGVLCFEEPENGVHPGRLARMAELLQLLATDFEEPEEATLPLRQVLCNTHSPAFISYQNILPYVLFAYITSRVDPENKRSLRTTRIVPLQADALQPTLFTVSLEERSYTLSEVRSYLESGNLDEALTTLNPSVLNGKASSGR